MVTVFMCFSCFVIEPFWIQTPSLNFQPGSPGRDVTLSHLLCDLFAYGGCLSGCEAAAAGAGYWAVGNRTSLSLFWSVCGSSVACWLWPFGGFNYNAIILQLSVCLIRSGPTWQIPRNPDLHTLQYQLVRSHANQRRVFCSNYAKHGIFLLWQHFPRFIALFRKATKHLFSSDSFSSALLWFVFLFFVFQNISQSFSSEGTLYFNTCWKGVFIIPRHFL